ncbi:hypothetical protein KY360_02285 [Candidatus Woesearchaeota archaeon]|nr:hypothetical protein [Candidatus Woesearchaeota archaeon]
MEKFLELKEEAIKKLKTADHILTQTYPLVRDSKLLLAVMDNIFLSLTNAMSSLLYYERLSKSIPPFHDNFDSKFNMFASKLVGKHKIKKEHVELLQEVKDIILEHRKSPVEFTRKDCFVICSDDYDMKSISIDKISRYLSEAKSFVEGTLKLIKDTPSANNSV